MKKPAGLFMVKSYRGKRSLFFGNIRVATMHAEWLENELLEALNERGFAGAVTLIGYKALEHGFTKDGFYAETHR